MAAEHPLQKHYDKIKSMIQSGATNDEIGTAFKVSEATIRRFRKKNPELQAPPSDPDFFTDGDTATIRSRKLPQDELPTPEELMEIHGLNPEEWEAPKVVTSWWGDPERPMYQLKLFLARKAPIEFVFPARTDGYKAPKPKKPKAGKTKVAFIFGDQQAPYVNWDMHGALLNMVADCRPDIFVATGDGMDLPDISRHKDNPEWHVGAQECIDSYYGILRDIRMTNEDMEMHKLKGNHDDRIRNELLNRAERLYGIRRAQIPGEDEEEPVLGVKNLLRLDELRIELAESGGDYEHAQVMLSEDIGVRHGSRTGKDPALKTIDRLTHGIVIGHTHGQSINHRTIWNHSRIEKVLLAIETGTCAQIRGGIGFAVDPNWVNGGAVVIIHPDGSVHAELATFKDGYLYYRDKRYCA